METVIDCYNEGDHGKRCICYGSGKLRVLVLPMPASIIEEETLEDDEFDDPTSYGGNRNTSGWAV